MKQKVKCANCGVEREINRKNTTLPDYSFRCIRCDKEVAQDVNYREKMDKFNNEI